MIKIQRVKLGDREIPIDIFPNECPICHSKIEPVVITELVNWLTDAMTNQCHEFEIVSKCPFQDCGRLFISRYNQFSEKKGCVNGYYSLIESQPYGSKVPDF